MRQPGLALALALLLAPLAPPEAVPAEELVDGIAAQVGSEIVLVSEVRRLAEPTEEELRRQGASERDLRALRAQVLDRLIERALVRQVVKRAELSASEEEVTDSVAEIAAQNGLTLAELRRSVEQQGMSFAAYRERIRAEIEQAKVLNGMVGSQVQVSEQEVRALYEERYGDQPEGGTTYRLRHILVPFRGGDAAARERACERVEAARERIERGASFAEVAREVSAVAADSGGEIGTFHSDSLAGWMRPAVERLEPGQTSRVLRTDFGCNLLQVTERRRHRAKGLEEVRAQLQEAVYQRKLRDEYRDFLERIRRQTYIDRKGIYADVGSAEEAPAPAPGPAVDETVLGDETF